MQEEGVRVMACSLVLMMEAWCSSEMWVDLQQTARYYVKKIELFIRQMFVY
jgi:hypothetical protein